MTFSSAIGFSSPRWLDIRLLDLEWVKPEGPRPFHVLDRQSRLDRRAAVDSPEEVRRILSLAAAGADPGPDERFRRLLQRAMRLGVRVKNKVAGEKRFDLFLVPETLSSIVSAP